MSSRELIYTGLKLFVADSLKKSKQRFGEFEFKYFGGSDVANKLLKSGNTEKQHLPQIGSLFVYEYTAAQKSFAAALF